MACWGEIAGRANVIAAGIVVHKMKGTCCHPYRQQAARLQAVHHPLWAYDGRGAPLLLQLLHL